MEMRHLRAFLAVAEELHFGRAATRLRIAQPAVSTAIRELEDEIGVRLFDRTRRRVSVSAAGEHFRPALVEALSSLEAGVRAARRAARGEAGRVVVTFTAMAALQKLPALLARFRRQRPDVQLILRQRSTIDQLEDVRGGRCDLAFTILPGDVAPLSSADLASDPLVVVFASRHPFARAKAVRIAQLAGQPMLLLPRATEPGVSASYHRICGALRAEPTVAFELEHVETILTFVAAEMGIALLPASVARLRFPGVASAPLSPRISSGPTVIWDAERLSPAARALLDEVVAS